MDKKMNMKWKLGLWGLYRDPSIQIIPTLGPKVCKYYLHWAFWIPRVGEKQELESEYADLMGMKNMEMADLRARVQTLEWESIKERSAHRKDVEEERTRSWKMQGEV